MQISPPFCGYLSEMYARSLVKQGAFSCFRSCVRVGSVAIIGGEAHMFKQLYKRDEKLRLYRSLIKGASRFPLRSRRDIVTEEVRSSFRHPLNDSLTNEEVDRKLVLGWERAEAIKTYAQNMYWFHSRDEVSKEMMHHSLERDRQRVREMERCNTVGAAPRKTPEVTEFKSSMYNVHPDYYEKIGQKPLTHTRDIWRARGQYGSDVGGPRQKFFVRRFKALFPQGW
ncbi:Complex1_LYR-like, putative [Trypanosoma equiperdum]|uniref:Complex1_LYR-like, putative n=1 Tax=Trypanosoma equiperdum TaxID=5694 RepID=A0A1G4IB18_TRYEQ|nr:Complex1_LYR-like, putative [Trypanosoma equiperdum]